MNTLKGKNILITGASSGIGKALAREAAKLGANLALAARREDVLLQLKNELENLGVTVIVVPTDVAQRSQCQNFVNESILKLGCIDVLINNAGISMRAPFHEVKIAVLREIMEVNYWGALYCTQAALPFLLKTQGSLVAVSSVTGFKGLPGRTGYAASKFAMHGLFESIRMEYMHKNLHTLIACPGFTASNIRINARKADGTLQEATPEDESKMDSPELVARDILRAVMKRKNFMLVNKQGKLINWLNKFFPDYVEQKIQKVIAKEPNSPIQ